VTRTGRRVASTRDEPPAHVVQAVKDAFALHRARLVERAAERR
jgi:hypothetical protein